MHPSISASLEAVFLGAECSGPVPESEIAAAEVQLGIVFPPSYRQFLSIFGAALRSPIEVAGLVCPSRDGEPPTWTDVVKNTIAGRSRASVPAKYLAVSHDGMDCTYYLDTLAVSEDGEGPVVAVGPGREFELVAASFLAFVQSAARGAPP